MTGESTKPRKKHSLSGRLYDYAVRPPPPSATQDKAGLLGDVIRRVVGGLPAAESGPTDIGYGEATAAGKIWTDDGAGGSEQNSGQPAPDESLVEVGGLADSSADPFLFSPLVEANAEELRGDNARDAGDHDLLEMKSASATFSATCSASPSDSSAASVSSPEPFSAPNQSEGRKSSLADLAAALNGRGAASSAGAKRRGAGRGQGPGGRPKSRGAGREAPCAFNAEAAMTAFRERNKNAAEIKFISAFDPARQDARELHAFFDNFSPPDGSVLPKAASVCCFGMLLADGSTTSRVGPKLLAHSLASQAYAVRFPPPSAFLFSLYFAGASHSPFKHFVVAASREALEFARQLTHAEGPRLRGGGPVICSQIQKVLRPLMEECLAERPDQMDCEGWLDVSLMAWLLDGALGDKATCLTTLSLKFLKNSLSDAPTPLAPWGISTASSEHWDQSFADARLLTQLVFAMKPHIARQNLQSVLLSQETPLAALLGRLDCTGVAFDEFTLSKHSLTLQKMMNEIEEEAHRLAGEQFLVSSPQQVSHILFVKLRLTHPDENSSGPGGRKKLKTDHKSTGDRILQSLSDKHPVVPCIQKYRSIAKILNTYIEPLKPDLHLLESDSHHYGPSLFLSPKPSVHPKEHDIGGSRRDSTAGL